MRCKCGYSFSGEAAKTGRKFESFAVVSDRDYQAFLKSESRVVRAENAQMKMWAIACSSEFVGSLLECPKCSRLLLAKPGDGEALVLRRED